MTGADDDLIISLAHQRATTAVRRVSAAIISRLNFEMQLLARIY